MVVFIVVVFVVVVFVVVVFIVFVLVVVIFVVVLFVFAVAPIHRRNLWTNHNRHFTEKNPAFFFGPTGATFL